MMMFNFINEQYDNGNMDKQLYDQLVDVFSNIYTLNTTSLILINAAIAVVFFVASVIIDSRKQYSYRTQDNRQPAWYPRYLDADDDVMREANVIQNDPNGSSQFAVKAKNLVKVYGNGYPAVGGVSFGI